MSLVGLRQQREGGGADGAAEADGLLVEELKGELAQTKLELETTLKAQHKHLKEMETLRLDLVLKQELEQNEAYMDDKNSDNRDGLMFISVPLTQ